MKLFLVCSGWGGGWEGALMVPCPPPPASRSLVPIPNPQFLFFPELGTWPRCGWGGLKASGGGVVSPGGLLSLAGSWGVGTRIITRPNSKRQIETSGIHGWKFRKTEGGHLSSPISRNRRHLVLHQQKFLKFPSFVIDSYAQYGTCYRSKDGSERGGWAHSNRTLLLRAVLYLCCFSVLFISALSISLNAML